MFLVIVSVLLTTKCSVLNAFTFPDVVLEAFEPEGFRATIPEIENVRLFAFHGNKNRPISLVEPGEFSMDILNPKTNGWSYVNPNLKLKVGDKIYYWLFIQHENFGYRKDDQMWEVTKLLPSSSLNLECLNSETEVFGPVRVCKNQLILDSAFSNNKTIDEYVWKRAHYIPDYPDYEFCSYQNRKDTGFIKGGKLVIKPIPAKTESDVRGTLDLRNGCTSHSELNCITYENSGFILPPVICSKMKTNTNFKYGKVEVKAKLPAGDWIYPEIFLESSVNRTQRIWIAYARGNEHLNGNGGDDIGGTFLFGGPVTSSYEPDRSKHLTSTKSTKMFSSDFHTFTVIWEPSKISVLVNGILYGETKSDVASLFNNAMHVVIGLGVGGVTDFPDYYVSAKNKKKPWINYERLQFRKFFNARNDWLPTWENDKSSLIVEHVKVWAL